MNWGFDMPGFHAIRDSENAYNKLVYSSFYSIEMESTNVGISLKYVSSGEEYYELDGKEFRVLAGQFLLVNHQTPVKVQVHSKNMVDGICLYIDPVLLDGYRAIMQRSQRQLLDDPQPPSFSSFHCRELVYPLAQSPLKNFIHELNAPNPKGVIHSPDFYYKLTQKLAQHQEGTETQIQQIQADKKSTQEELYRRLLMGQNYIHDMLGEKLLIRDVSRAACMSEFHFMRSFKQAFGLTPNQYILQQRIDKASSLLRSGKYPISEVSSMCGFSDHHYFSRCFKKVMGFPPSKLSF